MFVFTQNEDDSEGPSEDPETLHRLRFVYEEDKTPNGLFGYLRRQNSNRNPHEAGSVKVTASSFDDDDKPENVLDWGTSNRWQSRYGEGQWIDFDLLSMSFVLDAIVICTYALYFPQSWVLYGSDGSDDFSTIHLATNDTRLETELFEGEVVSIPINCSTPYSRFRIVAKDKNFFDFFNFSFHSIEFFGSVV
jgi:hypothetical protein